MMAVLIFIILMIVCLSPAFFIIYLAARKAKQREKDILGLSDIYKDELGDGLRYSVRYASKARYKKIWKFFPWEDYGILGIKKDALMFYSKDNRRMIFPAGQVSIEWIGANYWPNGIVSWFLIRYGETEHYFTSETGKWALKTDATTKEIFDKIKEVLIQ